LVIPHPSFASWNGTEKPGTFSGGSATGTTGFCGAGATAVDRGTGRRFSAPQAEGRENPLDIAAPAVTAAHLLLAISIQYEALEASSASLADVFVNRHISLTSFDP
jgi:hypothetical protein